MNKNPKVYNFYECLLKAIKAERTLWFLFLLLTSGPVLPPPAVDRSVSASLSDARDAMTNAAIDSLTSYRQSVLTIQQPGLLAPACLRLFPLFILALLKQVAYFIII